MQTYSIARTAREMGDDVAENSARTISFEVCLVDIGGWL